MGLSLDTAHAAQIAARNQAAKVAALQAQARTHADPRAAAQYTADHSGFSDEDDDYSRSLDAGMAGRGAGGISFAPGEYVGEYAQAYGGQYASSGYAYEEEDDEDDYGDEEEEDDDLSSSPSIPDENIDFDLVYALHNFIATVEGQATVQKGNSLTLLDDSNSYWYVILGFQWPSC